MSNLTIKPNWHDEINQVDVTEPIIGGDGGNANLAARQLAESMLWLKLNMQALVPMGYIYHSHEASNPKPKFDALLGIETHWRRITGKVMVGTNPTDPFIKEVGAVLGQKGMTTPADGVRPNTYPLQATNIFERYDPNVTLTPTYTVYANKQTATGGSTIEFIITGINTVDNRPINWVITEGVLNETGVEITVPDGQASGLAYLRDGEAHIKYDLMDEMPLDPARHVVFTAAAPVDDVVIVPILENKVVAKLSFNLSATEQSVVWKSGSRTITRRAPAFLVTNVVTQGGLTIPEFSADGRRWYTYDEFARAADSIGDINRELDHYEMYHIWVHLPDDYVDPTLYDIDVTTGTKNFFNTEIVKDTAYDGMFKNHTSVGEQAHRNWIKLKMIIRNANLAMPVRMPVTVTVSSKG